MPDRIDQRGEQLFTVRPRTSPSVTRKRGTKASIRFILPVGADDTEGRSTWLSEVEANVRPQITRATDRENDGYVNFIAQSVSYDIREKSQIMHTFGGREAVYFFGRSPVMVNLTGLLVDDLDNDQYVKFMNLYDRYLRGSQASSEFCYVEVSLNNCTFTGAFTGISIQQASDRDTDITFAAQFLAKSYTLSSTDNIFLADGSNNIDQVILVRDEDPTITQASITATISANNNAVLLAALDTTNADLIDSPTLSLGDYTRSFGTLPTVSDLIGFDAGDITDFFGDINDVINNITKPIADIANQIDNFARDVIGLAESVENGIDSVFVNIESATATVYTAIDSINDAVTTIVNFPESLADKLVYLGISGGSLAPSIAGSENISSSDAILNVRQTIPVGSSRGTPEGTAAELAISRSANNLPTLSRPSTDNPATVDVVSGPDALTPVPSDPTVIIPISSRTIRIGG